LYKEQKPSDIAAAAEIQAVIEAKLAKALKAMELAVKYKDIIDKCPQCLTLLLNSENKTWA
jgi:hypothetical protein